MILRKEEKDMFLTATISLITGIALSVPVVAAYYVLNK